MKNYPHNPILPQDVFVPDAEAHVWDDGRMYIYGSLDIEGRMSYCSSEYRVFSSPDLINWTDHGVSFTSFDISWLNEEEKGCPLYAPDCAYRDGKYYLYYCIPDGRCGVAVSESQTGYFKDVAQLEGVDGIDPAVFIDDDGQAYLYWGQFDRVRAAKLKPNMTEIEKEGITQPLSVAGHEFHEGSSVKKINSKYYFVFTDTHRHAEKNGGNGMATCLGYAVSDDPMSGFRYGGIIIDNYGCDGQTWNNHGSIQCFMGKWYVFYHRSTYASKFSRHVCIESLEILPDGSIGEVKMTSCGISAAISAEEKIAAAYACELGGNVRIEWDKGATNHLVLSKMRPNDRAVYRYIEFDVQNTFSARLRATGKLSVELLADNRRIALLECSENKEYCEFSAPMLPLKGKYSLILRVLGSYGELNIDELSFSKL